MTFPEIIQNLQSDFVPRTPILLLRPSKRAVTQQYISEQITTYCENNNIRLYIMEIDSLEKNAADWSTRQPVRVSKAAAFYILLKQLNDHPDTTMILRLKLDECSKDVGQAIYNVLINRQLYDRPFPDNLIVITEFNRMDVLNDIFDVEKNETDLRNHFYIVKADYYGDPIVKGSFAKFTGFKHYFAKRRTT